MSEAQEKNKALIRRFLEAHAKGDLDTLDKMLAPDFVDHTLMPGQQPGREGYLGAFTEYHAAYSDTRYVIEKQVAEGDEVVTTFAVSATHDRGEWMGLVPTGKEFKALLVLIHRIVGGQDSRGVEPGERPRRADTAASRAREDRARARRARA
ncbi:MAG: ester cyclase [Actinomycetota bacterium]|nr:ester cyclase [Actinomycetota bacterium]